MIIESMLLKRRLDKHLVILLRDGREIELINIVLHLYKHS
jgi:hypothetical protein